MHFIRGTGAGGGAATSSGGSGAQPVLTMLSMRESYNTASAAFNVHGKFIASVAVVVTSAVVSAIALTSWKAGVVLEMEKKTAALHLEAAQKDKEHTVATLLVKSELQLAVARAESHATTQVLDFKLIGHADYERLSKLVSARAGLVDVPLAAGPETVTAKAGE